MPQNSQTQTGPRVVRVTNLIPPYRLPVWQAIDRRGEVRFETWLMASGEKNRRWTLPSAEVLNYRVFPDWGIDLSHRDMFIAHFNPGILNGLAREKPDLVILGGYSSPTCMLAVPVLRKHSIPFLFAIESTDVGDPESDSLLGRGLRLLRRKLVSTSSGVLVPGRAARNHAMGLGVPSQRIFLAPNSVDTDRFRPAPSRQKREEFRSVLGLPGGTLCLYVGGLSERKGLRVLLQAFRSSRRKLPDIHLVIVGEGPLREALSGHVDGDSVLKGHVHLAGFCSEEQLPLYYSACDLFVFPTRYDIWGMVLNEAMSSGLPVISSDGAGASMDLVDEGVTGYRVTAEDSEALEEALTRLGGDSALRQRMGHNARRRILSGFTPRHQADGVVRAVLQTLESGGHPGA